MEIEIAEWDFSLSRCNDPIPFISFVPSMDFLELAARNNNEVWVTITGTDIEEYDGKSFKGVVDRSMVNNPCKDNMSAAACYYTMTFPTAPYVKEVRGGKFYINKPITLPPPTVLDPVENYEETKQEPYEIEKRKDNMDATSLAIIGALIALAFGIAIVSSTDVN